MSTRRLSVERPAVRPRTGPGARLAFAGAVSVAAALAVGELVAGILPDAPSPLLAVAQLIVDYQPAGAKDFVVGLFGTADKLAFQVFILLVALVIGAALGRIAPRRPELAATVLAVFAATGFAASLRIPGASVALSAGAAGLEALVGIWLLGRLTRLASDTGAGATSSMPDWGRRSLLRTGGGIVVGSLLAGFAGRALAQRLRAPVVPVDLPTAPVPADLPAGANLATTDLLSAGLSPIVTPNPTFYRIDTAIIGPPTVDRDTWSLTVKGLVDQQVTLSHAELVAFPIVEQYVTIACVSNYVGGDLVGNAKWTGVKLRDVLAMAGVQGSADQLVGRSVDGFTAGMPVEWVMDPARVPMIAVAMNDEPLPREHGYPARLIVPGLYGYVSATKWLSELELTRFDQFQAFWVPRGWSAEAPILTQSRIDVPRDGASVPAGHVAVAGVAWAPDRGIKGVEVRVDGGDWTPARISAPISKATWVQWLLDWNATPGSHDIEVRATDGNGEVQTDQQSDPAPDGARGHHVITVNVT